MSDQPLAAQPAITYQITCHCGWESLRSLYFGDPLRQMQKHLEDCVFGSVIINVSGIAATPGDQNATLRQAIPAGQGGPDVAALVKTDLENRVDTGAKKYGQRLRPFNGRDALLDAYQEALDLVMYLRQLLFERDGQ